MILNGKRGSARKHERLRVGRANVQGTVASESTVIKSAFSNPSAPNCGTRGRPFSGNGSDASERIPHNRSARRDFSHRARSRWRMKGAGRIVRACLVCMPPGHWTDRQTSPDLKCPTGVDARRRSRDQRSVTPHAPPRCEVAVARSDDDAAFRGGVRVERRRAAPNAEAWRGR